MATFDAGTNNLLRVAASGNAAAPTYGGVTLSVGTTVTTGAIDLSHGNLGVFERPSGSLIINGASRISNDSTLTVTAYSGQGSLDLNGTMNIDGTSTVNMDNFSVSGHGTFHLTGEDALLRTGNVAAADTVKLDGGVLSLTSGLQFLGTITDSAPAVSQISPFAAVEVFNAYAAVRETFDRSSGMLDLFASQGKAVANLHFGGSGDLYAAFNAAAGNGTGAMVISSHAAANDLPTTYT
ncbi:MAG: hypothetical protein M3Y41_02350 [Pseudomonadota bacterium]|nr:hypothetical protein [Pseudomonadota bacterium]